MKLLFQRNHFDRGYCQQKLSSIYATSPIAILRRSLMAFWRFSCYYAEYKARTRGYEIKILR